MPPKFNQKKIHSNPSSGNQSIHRAIALLRAVARSNDAGARLTRLAQDVGLHVATARRILQALVAEELVAYNSVTKRYNLGFELFLLGNHAQQFSLCYLYRPALEKISRETQDCVFLLVRSGNDSLCIERIHGTYPIQTLSVEVGTRRPLGTGAGSQSMLAFSPEEDFEKIIQANAPNYPRYNGLTADKIRSMVLETKERGYGVYGVSDAFFHEDIISIGVPVIDDKNNLLAAISVSAIRSRMPKERQKGIVNFVRNAIEAISKPA